jgi:hypothetical protein
MAKTVNAADAKRDPRKLKRLIRVLRSSVESDSSEEPRGNTALLYSQILLPQAGLCAKKGAGWVEWLD